MGAKVFKNVLGEGRDVAEAELARVFLPVFNGLENIFRGLLAEAREGGQ